MWILCKSIMILLYLIRFGLPLIAFMKQSCLNLIRFYVNWKNRVLLPCSNSNCIRFDLVLIQGIIESLVINLGFDLI
jgi:hypothetical protein